MNIILLVESIQVNYATIHYIMCRYITGQEP